MALSELFDYLEDPYFTRGDEIISEIVENFLKTISPIETARTLALQYAEYLKVIALADHVSMMPDGVTEAGPYDYVTWERAISDSQTGDWHLLSVKIENLGNNFLNGSDRYIEDQGLGMALINLAKGL